MSDRVQRIVGRLGFDPTKKKGDQSVVDKALARLKEEHDKKLEEEAYSIVGEMAKIIVEKEKNKKDFEKKDQQLEKTLGKLENKLKTYTGGQPGQADSEESEEEAPTTE